jgi:O-antigen biosynthesis protein WbqV
VLAKLLKMAIRASIRIVALTAAYSLPVLRGIGPVKLVHAFEAIWPYALIFAALGAVYDLLFKTDRTPWRFASVQNVLLVIRSSTVAVLTFLALVFVMDRAQTVPRSTLLLAWCIDIGLSAGLLLVRRAFHEKTLMRTFAPFLAKPKGGMPLLMLGSLGRADSYLREVARESSPKYLPVALIAPANGEVGQELRGVEVITLKDGAKRELRNFLGRDGAKAILFLDDTIAPADLDAEPLGRMRTEGVQMLRLSRLTELGDGTLRPQLHEIKVEDLLSRPPVRLDFDRIRELISGQRIMVTGAGGSIGSEICRQVAALGCAHIGLLDNSEFGLFNIDIEIGGAYPTLSRTDILCDIRDPDRVNSWVASEQPDIIFHAAALKHVPLMENHPCESVMTNVVGTWNVAEAARANGAGHMIFISTDKAVDPGNVMGATKRLAESVVRVHRLAATNTRFSVVRFGNVLGSAGSVVPTFKAQIERGGPVTLTHPDVERYFMTIPEAVQLVLHATAKSSARNHHSGVFVLDMGKPVKIMDLARRLIELYGKVPGSDIEIKITGLRPGEKLTEELVDSTEEAHPCDPGVVEVTDRVRGARIDRVFVRRLEAMARTGASEPTRQMIFETLAQVRAAPEALSQNTA